MTPDVPAICAGLTKADADALRSAVLADCHEYWLISPVFDTRLAAEDWVLTALGLAVRAHLIAQDRKGEGV